MDKKSGNGQAAAVAHRYGLISMAIFMTVILFNIVALGQESRSGIISGSLIDSETGGAIIGASVMLEGTRLGAATDLNGQYIIKRIPPRIYNLVISSIGYEQTRIEAVSVIPGTSAKFDLILEPRAQALMGKKIVVKAKAVQNTEASLLKYRQLSNAVSDAISAEAISRAGSGDAASAITRVIGASVVGGGAAVLVELTDNTYKAINNIETELGIPVLGVIPEITSLKNERSINDERPIE